MSIPIRVSKYAHPPASGGFGGDMDQFGASKVKDLGIGIQAGGSGSEGLAGDGCHCEGALHGFILLS